MVLRFFGNFVSLCFILNRSFSIYVHISRIPFVTVTNYYCYCYHCHERGQGMLNTSVHDTCVPKYFRFSISLTVCSVFSFYQEEPGEIVSNPSAFQRKSIVSIRIGSECLNCWNRSDFFELVQTIDLHDVFINRIIEYSNLLFDKVNFYSSRIISSARFVSGKNEFRFRFERSCTRLCSIKRVITDSNHRVPECANTPPIDKSLISSKHITSPGTSNPL